MASVEREESFDEVIREVRRIKIALAQAQNFDIRRIMDDAREKQKKSGRVILSAPTPQK